MAADVIAGRSRFGDNASTWGVISLQRGATVYETPLDLL
jgi:hypothetical protein